MANDQEALVSTTLYRYVLQDLKLDEGLSI